MRAVVFAGVGAVEVTDVPEPAIVEPGDAVVRVHRAGICGSDLHFVHGKAPIDAGQVLGHEAVGVIEAVGPSVAVRSVGERVVVSFHAACGRCWYCDHGASGLCDQTRVFGGGTFGGGLSGVQAELARVPAADVNLLPVPPEVGDDEAVFVGDVLSTGVHAAALAQASSDDVVAVIGAGPVGLCTVQALLAGGVRTVVVVDRAAARLAVAERSGATTVDVTARNPEIAVGALTDGRGADVVIDAVGHPAAFESAQAVVRRGGRLVIVGMYAGEQVTQQLGVWWVRALEARFAGLTPVHATWRTAMAGLAEGRFDVTSLIGDRLPLHEAAAGYERFAAQTSLKVLLTP